MHVEPLRKASASYRREIAALKRQVLVLERQATALAKQNAKKSTDAVASSSERPQRFVAKGLVSLRVRLGLSAPELARLIRVSDQSIYNWERKKTTPRKEQLARIAVLRGLGKREARAQLEAIDDQSVRKRHK